MKYKLNLSKERWKHFLYFTLGLLILLEVFFYKSGFVRILIISLKLSFLHLSGYLIALKLFKDEFDNVALLFLGLSFGLILAAFWYYLPSLFGVNINSITYVVPIVLLLVGLGLHVRKESSKENSEMKNKEKKEELIEKQETKEEVVNENNN